MRYQVKALPASFLIDKNGIIVKKYKGFSDEVTGYISKVNADIKKYEEE